MATLVCASLRPLPAAAEERPWASGVTEAEEQQARAWFEQGNGLFAESQYASALARYRQALELWNHPAVHYNAAVCLINLDQPLAAYSHLEQALRYGEAPLGAENHRQALLYKKLLAGQLAEIEVRCDEPGAQVTLDGELLFRAPGSVKRRVLPGAHQLTAAKPGLLTETETLQLPPGKLTTRRLALRPLGAPHLRSVRRWDSWKPWAVLGGGVALGLAGVPFWIAAKNDYENFDEEVARLCPTGCPNSELPATVRDARSRAGIENGVAVGLFVVGGAVTGTGVALLILNQPRFVPDQPATGLSLRPQVSTRGVSLHANWTY